MSKPDSTSRSQWITLGTVGGPFQRVEGYQISNALDVDGHLYLFDVGNGVLRQLAALGRSINDVRAVYVTHFHPDHMADLGLVIVTRWLSGSDEPLRVYGPEGTSHLVDGIVRAYEPVVLASAHGEPHRMPLAASVTVADVARGGHGLRPVDADELVSVEAADVDHFRTPNDVAAPYPHAIGFRITTPSRVIAYTGDSGASNGIAVIAQGADLLVTEVVDLEQVVTHFATLPIPAEVRERLLFNMEHNHLPPAEIKKVAARADVGSVLLTHFVPAASSEQRAEQVKRLSEPWQQDGSDAQVLVAEDLGHY